VGAQTIEVWEHLYCALSVISYSGDRKGEPNFDEKVFRKTQFENTIIWEDDIKRTI
jgi:hypothetical protein